MISFTQNRSAAPLIQMQGVAEFPESNHGRVTALIVWPIIGETLCLQTQAGRGLILVGVALEVPMLPASGKHHFAIY